MWARTQLKIDWSDLTAGALACVMPGSEAKNREKLEGFWDEKSDCVIAYSVRSGFDLLLQALKLEEGDEIIFSALNVKGMINIARREGYTPVPVDLDVAHMAPSVERLKRAISNRSRVLVVAHLFGTHVDLEPIFELARAHNLFIVEDCAQVFDGKAYPGHPGADVSMFSFGPLKTSTALGGALIRVHDDALRDRMREIQSDYPVQSESDQLVRVLKFGALKTLTSKTVLQLIYKFFAARGKDYETSLSNSVRNVAKLGSAKRLRFRPSKGLLALMARRVLGFKPGDLSLRAEKGRRLRDLIGDAVVLPGQASKHHDYWVFPMLVDEPDVFVKRLKAAGFDSSDLPRSQAVAAPEGREDLAPTIAAQALKDMIVVPCYPGMSDEELQREASLIREIARDVGSERTREYAAVKPK